MREPEEIVEVPEGEGKNSEADRAAGKKSKWKDKLKGKGKRTTGGEAGNSGEGSSSGQRIRRKGPHGKEEVEITEIDVLYENQRG